MNEAREFVGSWRLISWSAQTADGRWIGDLFGSRPDGLLTLTEDNVLHAQLMRTDRSPLSVPRTTVVDQSGGDVDELASAFNTYAAYAGSYEILDGKVLRTTVTCALIPGWEGSVQERTIELVDGDLVLTTHPRTIGGIRQVGVLRFRAYQP